jgi:hypothetical protein
VVSWAAIAAAAAPLQRFDCPWPKLPPGSEFLRASCLQIAPTMEEAKALKMFKGPPSELSPPEQFLLAMASVPHLVNKASGRQHEWPAWFCAVAFGATAHRLGSSRWQWPWCLTWSIRQAGRQQEQQEEQLV